MSLIGKILARKAVPCLRGLCSYGYDMRTMAVYEKNSVE